MEDEAITMEHDDIYFEEILEGYAEDDEITPAEEGFMYGYLEGDGHVLE